MTDAVLTRDRILETAEDVLRRFGPSKATVVDVARALGVSHGSVYRHFPSKAALRDAVTEQWLARVSAPLDPIVAEDSPAPERLRRWLDALIATKRGKVKAEPELFATYRNIFAELREVVLAHVDMLIGQIRRIIADGIRRGEFEKTDPAAAAQAVFYATARFHDPAHAPEWLDPGIDAAFENLWSLILRGLTGDATGAGKPAPRRAKS